ILRLLADGLVEQDRAADVFRQVGRGQEQLAVGAAVLFAVLDADAGKALGDGARGLVDRDDALARGDHGEGGFGKLFNAHTWGLRAGGRAGQYSPSPRPGRRRGPCRAGAQSAPRPCAAPSSPTCSRRSVLVAPWVSMVSPLVNTTRSPAESRPAATSRPIASRAASRAPWPRLSCAIGNTSRIRLMRRRAPAWRENA